MANSAETPSEKYERTKRNFIKSMRTFMESSPENREEAMRKVSEEIDAEAAALRATAKGTKS